MKASNFLQFNNDGLLKPDSNPTEFNVFVHSRSDAAAASSMPYMARCNRQTMSSSCASDGGSTYNSRNTSPHRCAFLTYMTPSFNGRLFRDTLVVLASEIRNLTASSRSEWMPRSSRSPPLCCCVSSPPSQPTSNEFLETARLLYLCRPILSGSLCENEVSN